MLPVRGGLIFGGAYTWKGLFLEFYGTFVLLKFGKYIIVYDELWSAVMASM